MVSGPYSDEIMRRGAWHYLSGRAISAVLTLGIQLWLVRLLSIRDYGTYVTLLAALEVVGVLAALGLHWAVARFVPEYRLAAPVAKMRRFIARLFMYRLVALLVAGTAWLLSAHTLLQWTGVDMPLGEGMFILLSALLIVEGMSVFVRDNLLGALVQQRAARKSQITRNICWLALLGLAVWHDGATLMNVVAAQVVASSLGLAMALKGLQAELRAAALSNSPREGWQEPMSSEIRRTCSQIYVADLVNLASSAHTFTLMLQRFAGNEAAAVFGFIRVLYSQLSQYLPANLLFSLIQPKLAASYADGGGMPSLTRNANLAGKISLLVLMPVLAFTAVSGGDLVQSLSGGRFSETGLLLFAAVLAMVPGSQGQLVYAVAVVSGNSGFCTAASVISLLVFPFMWILLQINLAEWAAVLSMIVGNTLIVGFITLALTRRAGYRFDIQAVTRYGFAAIGAWICATLLPQQTNIVLELTLTALIILLSYTALILTMKPFSTSEQNIINNLIKRSPSKHKAECS